MANNYHKNDISDVLNKIRVTSSSAYQSQVPIATAQNIVDVGEAVIGAPPVIRNEFMTNLYNKIGMTLIDSPVVDNPYSFLKKGKLEYGQTIEDIYVGLAKSEPYVTGMNPNDPIPDPFSIKKLPHKSAFYSFILSRQYQVTRHLTELRKAFRSASGISEFVAGMMNAMTSGENWDDYRATIALLARQIEEAQNAKEFKGNIHLLTDYNNLYGTTLKAKDAFYDKKFLQYFSNQLKKYSKRLRHVRTDFNMAGVEQNSPAGSQRIMMPEDITVDFETELLAWAYHRGALEIGGVDEIDAWYSIGAGEKNNNTVTVNPEDIQVKSKFTTKNKGSSMCVALIYDPGMAKIYNKERIASDQANNKGNYWNMFMSLEDIYAASPYRNMVAFMLD